MHTIAALGIQKSGLKEKRRGVGEKLYYTKRYISVIYSTD